MIGRGQKAERQINNGMRKSNAEEWYRYDSGRTTFKKWSMDWVRWKSVVENPT